MGKCDAVEGKEGIVKQVLKLGGEEFERNQSCFNAIENGCIFYKLTKQT